MNPYTAGDKVAYKGRKWTVKYTAGDKVKLYKPQPSGEPKETMADVGPGLTAFEEKVHTPRYLEIAKSTPEIQDFIAYLRTPEACCLLGLEARDERVNENIRKQYRDLTGEELTEGEGYHVAPLSAGKQGCEGYVTFVIPEVIPEEISARMVQREGLINHIDFLWLLVQEGFRIKR